MNPVTPHFSSVTRQSPRLSATKRTNSSLLPPPHQSPTLSNAQVDSFLVASPALQPLHQRTLAHVPSGASASPPAPMVASASPPPVGGDSLFVHPSSITHSPLTAPVNAMAFLKSLNRAAAPGIGATRSRRGSLAPGSLIGSLAGTSSAAAAAAAASSASSMEMESKQNVSMHLLRSTTTSPTIGSRPQYHTAPTTSSAAAAASSSSQHPSTFNSPSTSPFMASQQQRRSPRGHSPFQASSFNTPSPGLNALQTQSPNMSFSLPSPSLLGMTPNLTSSTRTNEGGLSLNQSHMLLGGSQIFAHWEGESVLRRSPRFTPQHGPMLSVSRRSPSFTMFSPAAQPSYSQLHHAPVDISSSASAAASSSSHTNSRRNLRDANPSHPIGYSPAMNGNAGGSSTTPVPSSPNLSILGKLRSLHHSGDSLDPQRSVSPAMKLEDAAMRDPPRGMGKRSRNEYESQSSSPYHSNSPSPSPAMHHHQQQHHHHLHHHNSGNVPFSYAHHTPAMNGIKNTPHFGGAGGYSLTSPQVGSLPPSQHSMSMVDVPAANDADYDHSTTAQHSPKRPLSSVTPKRSKASKKEPRGGGKPKHVPEPVVEEQTAPEEAEPSPTIAGNGSGSSCHQCKSRRLIVDLVYCCNMWKKGADRKMSINATSSAQHSCRKKYCGNCLTKFYRENAPVKRGAHNSEFQCPACRGICCCAACRRIKAKQLGDIDPTELPTSTMLAYSYVYCPDVLKNAMGDSVEQTQAQPHTVAAASNSPAATTAAPTSSSSYHNDHHDSLHLSSPYTSSLQASSSSLQANSPQHTGGKGKHQGGGKGKGKSPRSAANGHTASLQEE